MDRSKWEYKKLGEVAKFIGGGTPSKANEEYYKGNIPWATVRDMTNFYLSQTELSITEQAVKESATNIIPKDTIIISTHVGLGKICLLMQDTAINQDLKGVILPSDINKMYFIAWYRSISDYIRSNGKGATVKGVTMKFVNELSIPLPSLADQQRIVAELDCLNEMIAVKQEQMKEFDKLAQSIFYDMFGEGYEKKKLGDFCEVGTGSTPSRKNENLYYGGQIPWVKTTEVQNCDICNTEETITEEAIEQTNCKTYPIGTILMAMYGQGKTRGQIARLMIEAATNQACAAIIPNYKICDRDYLYEYLLLSYEKIRNMARGGNQANLNLQLVKSIPVPIPPLALQQQFAEKISAIEAQKELVKQSIAETQHLLDYTMDKYFG